MVNEVQLKRSIVKRADLLDVVDTSFNYFASTEETVDTDTVPELFRLYRKLYLEIPATGAESHQSLVEQSSKIYNSNISTSADIAPLQAEIADLRKRLLQANEQIAELMNLK